MHRQHRVFSKKNRMFNLQEKGVKLPNLFMAIVIFLGVMIASDLIGGIPSAVYDQMDNSKGSLIVQALLFASMVLIIPFGLNILAFFYWVTHKEKRKISTMGFEKGHICKKYLNGFVKGILMIAIGTLILYILGMMTIDYRNPKVKGLSALWGILIVLIGWMIQGAAEEIMLRGWMMPVIGSRYNVPLAIFVSSSIFSALHLFNDNISILSIINLVLFGVFASFYFIKEGTLWGICALHSSWNWAQGNIFGYEVSGIVPKGGILIDFNPAKGYDLFTGGPFGFEGGVICSVILLCGIIILYVSINKASSSVKLPV